MKITYTGKNIEVSDALREMAEKKLAKLDRYFPSDTEVQVTMSVEKNRHIIEVTIAYAGGIIRGEEECGDMYAGIDNVVARLEKQIRHHRTKLEKALRYEDEPKEYDYDDEDDLADSEDEDIDEEDLCAVSIDEGCYVRMRDVNTIMEALTENEEED